LCYFEGVKSREVIAIFKQNGWIEARHGRHLILEKDGMICPIPIHAGKDLRIGTLKSIERITGVKLR
jgi:predicted RNA binding protein YcfA (HicA-like mRNA interferase family)